MSLCVLDTDIVTLHQHNHPQVVARVQACAPDELAITVVTVEEQMRGRLAQIGRSGVDLAVAYDQLRATADYFCDLTVLPFDAEATNSSSNCGRRGFASACSICGLLLLS